MDYDAVANNVIMNQLCKVCGEPAAGFHFGAFTCEGCKSFFGRTYNNISSISECKNNGECVINKKNRTACKACRLRKCLLVGMSKSGSRYGRRSNWFKIHCLLQERQQQQHQQQQLVGVGVGMPQPPPPVGLLRPHPYLSPLFATPTTTGPLFREASGRSSESDSGASSADPEDDVRSTSTLGYLKPSSSPGSDYYASKKLSPSSDSEFFVRKRPTKPAPPSPASLPSVSPSGVVPKWLPPVVGISDPSSWRDTWTKVVAAAPAPDQDQPIDLSVKKETPTTKEEVKCEEDGVLDLTLDRQSIDVDGVSKG